MRLASRSGRPVMKSRSVESHSEGLKSQPDYVGGQPVALKASQVEDEKKWRDRDSDFP